MAERSPFSAFPPLHEGAPALTHSAGLGSPVRPAPFGEAAVGPRQACLHHTHATRPLVTEATVRLPSTHHFPRQ